MERTTNRNLLPLEDEQLRRTCPAIFAQAPRNDVSSRYSFVDSAQVLSVMRANGFVPTQAQAYHKRNADNRTFAKHMVRFRAAGDSLKKLTRGDVVPQICYVNSHDRSSQFHLMMGLWRLVCENGLMVAEGANVQPIVVRHTTSSTEGLMEAVMKLVKQQKAVFDHVDAMRGVTLTDAQRNDFAIKALALRPERAGIINPVDLLTPRRAEDAGDDVWRIYQRVQENMMKGGQRGVTANNRAVVTKGVTSVNADITLNSGLWRLAMEAIGRASASSAA